MNSVSELTYEMQLLAQLVVGRIYRHWRLIACIYLEHYLLAQQMARAAGQGAFACDDVLKARWSWRCK